MNKKYIWAEGLFEFLKRNSDGTPGFTINLKEALLIPEDQVWIILQKIRFIDGFQIISENKVQDFLKKKLLAEQHNMKISAMNTKNIVSLMNKELA